MGLGSAAVFPAMIMAAGAMPGQAIQAMNMATRVGFLAASLRRHPEAYLLRRVLLDGEDITHLIRTPDISMAASHVSAVPAVRRVLVRLQQDLGRARDQELHGVGTLAADLQQRHPAIRVEADRIFITTAGVGCVPEGISVSGHNARPGDVVLCSGALGDHGMAIMIARGSPNLSISTQITPVAMAEITTGVRMAAQLRSGRRPDRRARRGIACRRDERLRAREPPVRDRGAARRTGAAA